MISHLYILLLLPFWGFGEGGIVDESTENPNDVMTTAHKQILSEDTTQTVTESVDPVPKSITIETVITLKPENNLPNTTDKK